LYLTRRLGGYWSDREQALKELASRASESQAKIAALDVIEKEKARTEGTHTTATSTPQATVSRPRHELGTPRPTPLQKLEQTRDAEEALQRQARERMEPDRQQVEDDLHRQQERDGGIER
jgi:hypothetical protein